MINFERTRKHVISDVPLFRRRCCINYLSNNLFYSNNFLQACRGDVEEDVGSEGNGEGDEEGGEE